LTFSLYDLLLGYYEVIKGLKLRIKDWVAYMTGVWNDEHQKLVFKISSELVWYKPYIRKRILREVEEALKHVKEDKEKEC